MTGATEMRIERIVLAVERMDEMARFYDEVFGTALQSDAGSPFRRGTLADIPLLLCPNEIAEVVAQQNRHQLRFAVDDLDAVLGRVRATGGVVMDEGELGDSARVAGVADPDGNTYELVAAR